jgi:hypothetical protein
MSYEYSPSDDGTVWVEKWALKSEGIKKADRFAAIHSIKCCMFLRDEHCTFSLSSMLMTKNRVKLRELRNEVDERLTSILTMRCCVQAVIYIRDKHWKFLTIHSSVDKSLPNVSKYCSSSRRCSSSIDTVDKATTSKLSRCSQSQSQSRCSQSQVWHVVYLERRQPFHPQWQWNHSTQREPKGKKN